MHSGKRWRNAYRSVRSDSGSARSCTSNLKTSRQCTGGVHKLDKVEEEKDQKLVCEPRLCQGGQRGTTDGRVHLQNCIV